MIEHLYDIAVIGGGLCGFASAVRAAQNGKSVLLVERRPALGWESTWACQLALDASDSALAQRIAEELGKIGGLKNGRMDAPILEMVLDKLAAEAGVSVLLYSYPVRLVYEDGVAFGVVIGNKSGEQIVKARVIVDATEEAILWRQTHVNVQKSEPPAKQAVFFNNAEGKMELPMKLSGGITVHPSVWEGEVCVEFEIDELDSLAAMRRIPDVLKIVREEVPQLKDALVTHAGNEPFPVAPLVDCERKQIEHPEVKNLFGAGIWSADAENTPTGRLSLGEKVGEIASECEGAKEFPEEMMTGSLIGQPEVRSDVLVIGGGTGGAIAAIAAGREGARTMLIEASPCLGGIGTGGAIHSYYHGVNGGIQDEVDQRVKDLTPLFVGKWKAVGFHPGVKKLVLQQMTEEAGVHILLNTVVTGVLCRENMKPEAEKSETGTAVAHPERRERRNELQSAIAVDAEGIRAYRAKVFIDSTGDGDVAVMAGAPFVIGREVDNLPHAYSQSSGRLRDGNLAHNNFDAGYVDPSDVADLTRGRRLGVSQYWRDKFTSDNRILYLAPIIGLRQSRQIVGEYQLTLADEIAGRRFEDAVSFTIAHYDNHHKDYENESDEAALWVWALGNWSERIGCEVPYRCMIPKNVDGLILACRAISMTYDAHMEFRMQNDIQRIGEVAGVAAAMAVRMGVSPRGIDLPELQSTLKKSGILDEKYRPKPAIQERKILELPAPDNLEPQQVKELVWLSSQGSPENALALSDMLNSSDPYTRFRASAALAWHGLDAGVPELLKCVEERGKEETEGRRNVPSWQAAIPFLGMAKSREAVPILTGVLKDKTAGIDALIGAVRALGRIGDESAAPALRDFLKREDLPTVRVMNDGWKTTDDWKWQIDLATAETLSKLGAPDEETRQIIEPHLDDDRAYVRRYANKLLEE